MRKLLLAATLVVAALSVSGCSEYIQRAIDYSAQALTRIALGLETARETASIACAEIGRAETAAETAAVQVGGACSKWHTSVVKVRKEVEAICGNLPKLTDEVIGNYVSSVNSSLKQTQSAKPDGC